MSPVQTKNSVLGDSSLRTENMDYDEMEPIEPIEIPVDDVHSSDEESNKNSEGKYQRNGEVKLIKRNSELFGSEKEGTQKEIIDQKVNGVNGKLKEEEGEEYEYYDEGDEEKGIVD